MKATLRTLSLPAIAVVIGAVGCSSSATSPTAPSPTSAGATIQGTVQTGTAASSAELSAFSTAGGIKVTVVGTSLSTSTDPAGRFVLAGVAGGSATLRFQGQGVDGTIDVSGLVEGQTLTITVQLAGSKPRLVTPASPASPAPTPSPTGKKVEIEGTVGAVGASSVTVSGHVLLVNADTKIKRDDRTIALADLKMGDKVEVDAVTEADGSLLATRIKVEDNDDNDNDNEVDFKGTIESITAPNLMVSGRKVVTNGSTRIRSDDKTITLGDLKAGEKVEVEGTTQTDGSVLASKIKVEDGGDDEHDDSSSHN